MLISADIVERIVKILVHDEPDLSSTKRCSLVSHAFLHISRKQIFGSIILSDLNLSELEQLFPRREQDMILTTSLLVQLLAMTPQIAKYIRNLAYIIPTGDGGDVDNLSLIQTFKKISGLTSLTIWDPSHGTKPFQWSKTPLRPGLLYLLHTPNLVHLNIVSIRDFVVADLIPCVNLKDFEFGDIGTAELEDSPPSDSEILKNPIRLNQIRARRRIAEVLSKLCALHQPNGRPAINFGGMVNVSVALKGEDDVQSCAKLFGLCDQLVKVEIAVTPKSNWTFTGLSKMLHPSLRTLKHLHLSVRTPFRGGDTNKQLFTLASELEAMRNDNIIESISIKVTTSTHTKAPPGNEWGMLDRTLTRFGWPGLRRVSVRVLVVTLVCEDLQDVWKDLRKAQFPLLVSDKKIGFELVVCSRRT